jgi:hypothetical protein
MGVAELRRLWQLEDENTQLKQLVADLTVAQELRGHAARPDHSHRGADPLTNLRGSGMLSMLNVKHT